jgi:electron transport complex protein RnfE
MSEQRDEHADVKAGLWRENPALVQLLGLCPLLAVSGSVRTALVLGLTTLFVLVLANTTIASLRRLLDDDTRLPAQIMVIAALVTVADLLLAAYLFEVHQRIGLFVALIVTNCALLGRAEAYARRHGTLAAVQDGIGMGLGFLGALLVMGVVREGLGQGTLFASMEPLPQVNLPGSGILLFALPPGAFIVFGCLAAIKNLMDGVGDALVDQPTTVIVTDGDESLQTREKPR